MNLDLRRSAPPAPHSNSSHWRECLGRGRIIGFPRALAGLVVVFLSLCGCHKEAARAPVSTTPEAITVTATAVTNIAWDKTVAIVGALYPKDSATLAAQVEGSVERTLVDFGDRIRSDQVLALIDTALFEAQLQQSVGNLAKSEANASNAHQNYDRIVSLQKAGVASDSDFDQSKMLTDQGDADVKAARAADAIARLNLERSRVKAPFDGAVAQRIVGRGDFVKVGSPLFEVVNDSVLKFIFQVGERHGSRVKKGQPVTFSVDNYPRETFTGTVYLISPSVLTASRAFNVGALVTNTGFRLKANTFARGTLVLETGVPTSVVPLEAVVTFAGVTKVFVVENNVAHSRLVATGRIRDGLQEIVDGLRAGEIVVTSGQSRLSDGSPVTLRTSPVAASETPRPLAARENPATDSRAR